MCVNRLLERLMSPSPKSQVMFATSTVVLLINIGEDRYPTRQSPGSAILEIHRTSEGCILL